MCERVHIMNTQKGFSSLLGLLLFIVLAGGGLFYYTEKVSKEMPEVDTIPNSSTEIESNQSVSKSKVTPTDTIQANTNISISDQAVIQALSTAYEVILQKNSRGTYEAKFPPDMRSNVVVNKIVKGDLNNDKKEDAFVWNTVCGASCGSEFSIVLNGSTSALRVLPPGFTTVGAGQTGVKGVTINLGVITITGEMPSSDGSPVSLETFQYKLSGDSLVSVN